jgi:two-component sensor histidine kinase
VGPRNDPSSLGEGLHLDLEILATPGDVSRVRDAFGQLGLPPGLLQDARLLVSELVSNSIKHAALGSGDRIRVRAAWSGTKLRVDVIDHVEGSLPSPVPGSIRPPPGAESGWGLFLVDRLASRWGTAQGRYWFEIQLEEREEDREG